MYLVLRAPHDLGEDGGGHGDAEGVAHRAQHKAQHELDQSDSVTWRLLYRARARQGHTAPGYVGTPLIDTPRVTAASGNGFDNLFPF